MSRKCVDCSAIVRDKSLTHCPMCYCALPFNEDDTIAEMLGLDDETAKALGLPTKADKAPCVACGSTVGFMTDGYCQDCLCAECGSTLESEEERAMSLCFDCDEGNN